MTEFLHKPTTSKGYSVVNCQPVNQHKIKNMNQKSILDVEVGFFDNYRSTTPKQINLLKWLQSDKYQAHVIAIRKVEDKTERNKLKAVLPAITPSGIFTERNAAGLVHHSGFIQFDIDNVKNPEKGKQRLAKLKQVAYVGLSVSGRGLWGLIFVAHPEKHLENFLFIEKSFHRLSITIDKSCKDVSRLRGYSYDPNAYFNHQAIALKKYYINKPVKYSQDSHSEPDLDEMRKQLELCLSEIDAQEIDITALRNDWLAIGFGFSNVFGEDGRDYFQRVSRFYTGYDFDEADDQYNKCLKSGYKNGLGCFFKLCANAGIRYKQLEALTPEYWKQ